MADRIVKVLENGRFVTRGCSTLDGFVQAYVDKDETLTFTFDWSNWLGANTIASAAKEVNGPSVSAITTSGTNTSFTVSGNPGLIQHRITDSAGNTKEVRMRVRSPDGYHYQDYGCR